MARKGREKGRLKIQWIMDNTKRKVVLRRRLPILLKKARELAVLCGVPVCLVAYLPGKTWPVVWPSPEAATDVLRQFRNMPSLGRFKNVLDDKDFLEQMKDKVRAELSKVQRQNHDKEIKLILIDFLAGRRKSFDDLPTNMLASVRCMVQNKLEAINAINARLLELRSVGRPTLKNVPMVDNLSMEQPLELATSSRCSTPSLSLGPEASSTPPC